MFATFSWDSFTCGFVAACVVVFAWACGLLAYKKRRCRRAPHENPLGANFD
jgi:hypothetical protein